MRLGSDILVVFPSKLPQSLQAEPDSGVDDQQQPLLWGGSSDSSRQGNAHEEASESGQPEKFQIEVCSSQSMHPYSRHWFIIANRLCSDELTASTHEGRYNLAHS